MHKHACVYDAAIFFHVENLKMVREFFFSFFSPSAPEDGKQTMTLNKAFLHLSFYHDVSPPGGHFRAVKHEVGAVNKVCSIRLLTDGRGELYYSAILFLFFLNVFSFFLLIVFSAPSSTRKPWKIFSI